MKTETPPTQPTIAELWDRFEKLGNYIDTEKILQSWGTKGSDGMSHDGRIHSNDEAELQSLRQQLLERCSVPCYNFSASPLEEIEYHKEMSSIHGFWAWELEQRQKEKEAFND